MVFKFFVILLLSGIDFTLLSLYFLFKKELK